MARFETEGFDNLINQMEKMGQTTGPLAKKMLFAGAEQVKKAWKQAAKQHRLLDTGQMINSIDYSRKVRKAGDILSADIYPMGNSTYTESKGKRYTRLKPVRNAEVAFVNNYGTPDGTIKATHFVDTADDLAGPMIEEELEKIWFEWLEENGYM